MDFKRIAYWISTALMCGLFLFSAGMYFMNTEMIQNYFVQLGFPSWIVIPLAIAKVLGVIAVLSNINPLLREWAYAGFFFDVILAATAHTIAGDGAGMLSYGGILLVVLSRFLLKYRTVANYK